MLVVCVQLDNTTMPGKAISITKDNKMKTLKLTTTETQFLLALLQTQEQFYNHISKDKVELVKETKRICNDILYKLHEKD